MRQDRHPISRQMHIRLDGMRARRDGALEGAHCVLGPARAVASVGNGLGQAPLPSLSLCHLGHGFRGTPTGIIDPCFDKLFRVRCTGAFELLPPE